MARIHIGFKSKDEATNLHQELWGNQNVLKSSITTKKPKTGEYLVSIETSSNEIEKKIRNSGGRIISDEEYEALTAYSIGDLDDGWITDIQQNLASKGYYLPIYPSGIFDEETKYAVMAFQRDHNLKVDGIVNETVMNQIREAGNRP
ncbi:hypothetical protein STA3757_25360 [Stanieria sp. NIES-3757]|nr:hypothetical protein STA3757_25360 [Stanieria sp. NIES-3757]